MKYLLVSILCLFIIGCTTPQTSQPTSSLKTVELSQNTDGLYIIRGQINQVEYNRFMKNFKSIKILVLDSRGGVYEYSKHMATVIRRMQLITIVPNNATCESACTLLFQAGVKRIAGYDAKFMYHGLRYPPNFMKSYIDECPVYTNECEDRFEHMKLYITKLTLEYFFLNEYYGADRIVFKRFKRRDVDPNWLFEGNLTGHKDLWISVRDALRYKVVT